METEKSSDGSDTDYDSDYYIILSFNSSCNRCDFLESIIKITITQEVIRCQKAVIVR